MNEQHNHQSTPFTPKTIPILLVCDGVNSPANLGSLFRLGDAFGIEKLIYNSSTDILKSSRFKRTSRSSEKQLKSEFTEELPTLLARLKRENYQLIALEITSNSIPINQCSFNSEKKIALIIGNEKHGVSKEILELVDRCLHIEMFGVNSSMNVSHAAAISLYQLTNSLG